MTKTPVERCKKCCVKCNVNPCGVLSVAVKRLTADNRTDDEISDVYGNRDDHQPNKDRDPEAHASIDELAVVATSVDSICGVGAQRTTENESEGAGDQRR